MPRKEHIESEAVKFDLRLIDRYLSEGRISRKEYEEYLAKLADEESRGEYVEVYEEGADSPTPAEGDLTFTSG